MEKKKKSYHKTLVLGNRMSGIHTQRKMTLSFSPSLLLIMYRANVQHLEVLAWRWFFLKLSQGPLHSLFIMGNHDLKIQNNYLQPKIFPNTHKRLGSSFREKMYHYWHRDTVPMQFLELWRLLFLITEWKKMRGTFQGHIASITAAQNWTESLHFKQIFEH